MLYHCRFDHEVFSFNHSVDVRESDSNQSGKDQLVIAKSGRGRFRNFFITAYFSLHSFSLHSFHFITAYIFFHYSEFLQRRSWSELIRLTRVFVTRASIALKWPKLQASHWNFKNKWQDNCFISFTQSFQFIYRLHC